MFSAYALFSSVSVQHRQCGSWTKGGVAAALLSYLRWPKVFDRMNWNTALTKILRILRCVVFSTRLEDWSKFHEELHAVNTALLMESSPEQTVGFVRYSEMI